MDVCTANSLDDFKTKPHSRFADHVVFPHGKFVKKFIENLFIFYYYTDILTVYK